MTNAALPELIASTPQVGVFPMAIGRQLALALTLYALATHLLLYRCRTLAHIKALWFASVCNQILWFAYLKAGIRTLTATLFSSGAIRFKATAKGAPAQLTLTP